ncbi:MAG: hypothetical protein EBU33_08835 [Sphingobacteriia bacterium]|nr:hypothetical protein [Sphingobacteriia bacterium]
MTDLLVSEMNELLRQGWTLDQILEWEAEQKAMKDERAAIESEEARHPMWYNPMLEKENE